MARGMVIHIIMWAILNGFKCTMTTCNCEIEQGHLEVVQWLFSVNCPVHIFACDLAAQRGHLDIYKFLRKNGFLNGRSTWESAIKGGHLEIVKFIHNEFENIGRKPLCGTSKLSSAIAAKKYIKPCIMSTQKKTIFQ
jgi:hypothetical protein